MWKRLISCYDTVLFTSLSMRSGAINVERSELRLILSVVTIFVFVVSATMAAYFLQSTAASKRMTIDEHVYRLSLMQELENAIALSMFAPHDYLITGKPHERKVFTTENRRVERLFTKLKRLPKLEAIDRKVIAKAYSRYSDMRQTELTILSLPNPRQNISGPALMEKMHIYQNSILKEFSRFAQLDEDELELEQQAATQDESRWFVVIGIIGALVISVSTLAILKTGRTGI